MLLSWWFLAFLTAAAAMSAVVTARLFLPARPSRHRAEGKRPGRRFAVLRALATFLTAVLTVAAAADGVNRHFSYIPTFAALFGEISPDLLGQTLSSSAAAGPPVPGAHPPSHGVVEKIEIAGAVSRIGPRDTYVYLPPTYFDGTQPARRFPVLYLIHGSPGDRKSVV